MSEQQNEQARQTGLDADQEEQVRKIVREELERFEVSMRKVPVEDESA